MIYPDTVGFEHPDFTETDLPMLRSALASALGPLTTAERVAVASVNPSVSALTRRISIARDQVNGLLEGLQHRF